MVSSYVGPLLFGVICDPFLHHYMLVHVITLLLVGFSLLNEAQLKFRKRDDDLMPILDLNEGIGHLVW